MQQFFDFQLLIRRKSSANSSSYFLLSSSSSWHDIYGNACNIAYGPFAYPKPLPNLTRTSPKLLKHQTEPLEPQTEPQNELLPNFLKIYLTLL